MKWKIEINKPSLGGYAPSYWKSSYPIFGNINMASEMSDLNLTNPDFMTRGNDLGEIDDADTLIKGITKTIIHNGNAYGFGGENLYSITNDAITTVRTIAGVSGENATLFGNYLYYIWDGGMGKYDLDEEWDDGFWKSAQNNFTPQSLTPFDNGVFFSQFQYPNKAYDEDSDYAYAPADGTMKYHSYTFVDENLKIPEGEGYRVWKVEVGSVAHKLQDVIKPYAITIDDGVNWVSVGDRSFYETLSGNRRRAIDDFWVDWSAEDFNNAAVNYVDAFAVKMGGQTVSGQAHTLDHVYIHAVHYYKPMNTGVLHEATIEGSSGRLHIANGRYVASFDGDVLSPEAFDLNDDKAEIASHKWMNNKLWIALNRPTDSDIKEGSILTWDGYSTGFISQIKIDGEVGALFDKNGEMFVFYKRNSAPDISIIGKTDGYRIVDLKSYKGSLPKYYQISIYDNFIIWVADEKIYAFGEGEGENARIFQLCVGGTGGLANPFGFPVVAFTDAVKKFDGYSDSSTWKSLLFDVGGDFRKSMIDKMVFNIEKSVEDETITWTLRDNNGDSLKTGTLTGDKTKQIFTPSCLTENFRLELAWDEYEGAEPLESALGIKNILIFGHTVE